MYVHQSSKQRSDAADRALKLTPTVVCRCADSGSGIPGPGRCAHPPSVRERLRHAAQLGLTHPILTRSSKAQRLFDLVRAKACQRADQLAFAQVRHPRQQCCGLSGSDQGPGDGRRVMFRCRAWCRRGTSTSTRRTPRSRSPRLRIPHAPAAGGASPTHWGPAPTGALIILTLWSLIAAANNCPDHITVCPSYWRQQAP
jgi:hypothetical protein